MKYISFEKSVGGVVYRLQNGKILYLLLRYRSGQWDFPKGHIEIGESEEETLRREIKEETGIEKISVLAGFRTVVRYFYRAKGNEREERIGKGRGIYIFKKVPYYAVETKTSEVRIDFENKDFIWVDYAKALRRIRNDGSLRVIKAVENVLKERTAG